MKFTHLTQRDQTMRRRLFAYMTILIALVLSVALASLTLVGRYHTDKQDLANTLALQMEFWEKTLLSRSDSLAAMGMDFSDVISVEVDDYLDTNGLSFENLQSNVDAQMHLQEELLPLISEFLLRTEASGAYVLIDATAVSDSTTRSGVYLQRKTLDASDDSLLLYRGNAQVGREFDIMPHRKWRLELGSELFSNDDNKISYESFPNEWSYRYTPVFTLPGTSEQAILLQVPLISKDGTYLGICGFEVNQTLFKRFSQPAIYPHLSFMLTSLYDDSSLSDNRLVAGTTSDFFVNPVGRLQIENTHDSINKFVGDNHSFAGYYQTLSLGPESPPYVIAVMLPYEGYSEMLLSSFTQSIALIVLMVGFAGACCVLFSRHYVFPIARGLEELKTRETVSDSGVKEIDDLLAFLLSQDQLHEDEIRVLETEKNNAQDRAALIEHEYSVVKQEFEDAKSKQLKISKIQQIDPTSDDYLAFQMGLKELTVTERKIVQFYLEGKTVRDIQTLLNIKESTLRYHNRNIYSKLGVHSMKQLLQYAIYAHEHTQL